MKNKLFNIGISLLLASSFSGCSDDKEGSNEQVQTPAVLSGKAYTFDPEVEGEIWKVGKSVGMYMLKENSTEYVSSYQNVKYQTTTEPIGYFTPAVKEDVLYYPQDGSKVDIIAYYPWREDQTGENIYPMNVSRQNVENSFTFLYARNGKGLSSKDNKKELELCPVLSQLVFKLKAGDGVTDEYLTESVITVADMYTKANFDLLTGEFRDDRSGKQTIELVTSTEENSATGRVFPVTVTAEHIAKIELPKMNRTYNWDLLENIVSLEPGMRYVNTVTIGLDKITVETEEEAIGEWGEGDKNEVTGNENMIGMLIEDLPLGSLVYGYADPINKVQEGVWYYSTSSTFINDIVKSKVDEIEENNLKIKVICTEFTDAAPANWYGAYVGYRLKNAKAQKYRLTFSAKIEGSTNQNIACTIHAGEKVDGCQQFSTPDNANKGGKTISISNSFKPYSIVFDFSKLCNGIYGSENKPVTEKALADYYINFANMVKPMKLYLKDVSLSKVVE